MTLLCSCRPAALVGEGQEESQGTGEAALLWSIATKGGKRLLLAGSLHLLGAEDHPLPQLLFDGLDASDTLITETGALEESRAEIELFVRDRGTLPDGERLSDYCAGGGVCEQLVAYFAATPDALARLQSFRPWLASLQIATAAYRVVGMESRFGVDAVMLERATRRGMRIGRLESPAMQLCALADLSREQEVEILGEVLEELMDGTALAEYGSLKEAWRKGDLQALAQHVERIMAGAGEGKQSLEARMLSARNHMFAERIGDLAELPPEQAQDLFILVGAGHLVGAEGILARLGERLGVVPVRVLPGDGLLETP